MKSSNFLKALPIAFKVVALAGVIAPEAIGQERAVTAAPTSAIPQAFGSLVDADRLAALLLMPSSERDPILRMALVSLTPSEAAVVHKALVDCYYLIDHQSNLGKPPESCVRLKVLWELMPEP
jgi:hypothetical protein